MPRSQNNCLNKWVLIPPSSNHWIKMLAKQMVLPNMTMFCTCTFGLTKIPPAELIKATVIIIKSITDTVPAYRQKSLAEQEDVASYSSSTPVRKVRDKNTMSKIQATFCYTRQTLQRPRTSTSKIWYPAIWCHCYDLRTHGIKKMWPICWMFRKSNRSLRIFRNVTRSRRNGVK
jgi:hypothetical protein